MLFIVIVVLMIFALFYVLNRFETQFTSEKRFLGKSESKEILNFLAKASVLNLGDSRPGISLTN